MDERSVPSVIESVTEFFFFYLEKPRYVLSELLYSWFTTAKILQFVVLNLNQCQILLYQLT